jgi:hypothetical protein
MQNERGAKEATRQAVYFDERDYAGPIRRVAILCIDSITTVTLSLAAVVGIGYVWLTRYPESENLPYQSFIEDGICRQLSEHRAVLGSRWRHHSFR